MSIETAPTDVAAPNTGTDDLLAALEAGVLTLTLNRPEARNAMSDGMNQGLGRMLAWAELEPTVKCVVLTGAGKGFCAGGDVKGMAARDGRTLTIDAAIHRQRVNQRNTAGRLFAMPKPTLASLPGAAAGAGFSLALACDLRIMASTAILTTAFARVGFSGDYGGTYFLTQLVGSGKARELYYGSWSQGGARGRHAGGAHGEMGRRGGVATGPRQLGVRARGAGGAHAGDCPPPRRRPDRRLSLHEGEPQPGSDRRAG